MSTVSQVVAAAPSWRESTKHHRTTEVSDRAPSRAEVAWWVKTSELGAALAIVDGVSEVITLDPGPPAITVTRVVPLKHPQFANLYAIGYRLEDRYSPEAPVTGISGTGPQTLVTVKFSSPEWPYNDESGYQKVSARGFPHALEIDPAAVAFSGGGAVGTDERRPMYGMTYTISVGDASGVTAAQEAAWALAQGKVNSATWRGNAAGTVMVGSPSFDYRVRRDGSVACDYSLSFSVLPVRWDQSYKADGTLGTVLVGGGPKFAAVDLTSLFV
jgi:hypothetical protein